LNDWLDLKNGSAVSLATVPSIPYDALFDSIRERCGKGDRPVAYFGVAEGEGVTLFTVLANDGEGVLAAAQTELSRGQHIRSLTPALPLFHLFERELFEDFGILPEGHPWLKPVRYAANRFDPDAKVEDYPFFILGGEGVHEVAVGPVHAGVIEPGHFRFMCRGERVEHLEIQLGYQHRGAETLFGMGPLSQKGALAESICGTSAVAHAAAHAMIVEAASQTRLMEGAGIAREVLIEIERAGGHLATLSALAGDVAYLPGNSVMAGLRTTVINTLLELTGSRFGHGMIRPGGILRSVTTQTGKLVRERLAGVAERLDHLGRVMWSSPSVLSRFERTGTVDGETARRTGMVGPAGRASGVDRDARRDLGVPWRTGGQRPANIAVCLEQEGDVLARAMVRYRETLESIRFVDGTIASTDLSSVERTSPSQTRNMRPSPDLFAVGVIEGTQGEIVHTLVTGPEGETRRYKIKDPAFNNWYALALAVRGEAISDFPLCNKSFDLSYAGHDL